MLRSLYKTLSGTLRGESPIGAVTSCTVHPGVARVVSSLPWPVTWNTACVLNLSDRGLSDDRLNYLLSIAPQQSIILLEDIDAAFVSREDHPGMKTAYDGLSRLSLSGLLNALDGVASTEARILFMTTNYLERLDPALIRPGRVDYKQCIDYATAHQLQCMYSHFFPDQPEEAAVMFAGEAVSIGSPISLAQVQGYFMLHKNDARGALTNISRIVSI